MLEWYHSILLVLILISLTLSVFYSFSYRRKQEPCLRGIYMARMNMSMGLLLVLVSLLQAAMFEMSTLRLVLSVIFALLGLFNLFAGLKNHSYFRKQHDTSTQR